MHESKLNSDCANNFEKAYKSALTIINFAPQMEKSLTDKLKKKGYKAGVIKEVIDYLKELNLLDDENTSINYINSLITNKYYGYNLLLKKLYEKGLDRVKAKNLIESTIIDIDAEIEIIKKYINKKKELFETLYNDKRIDQIFGKLQTMGYRIGTIEKVINDFKNILEEVNNL